ncbi:uncharacterized oxidoreductase At4g09670-like [Cajanus cajan]|uniref:uncharacterized oxidoreductase At4g09670-like n=1 Tax=Cajanus cajan TaxID=3821 RepID=UPI0010FB93E4|nr:uncharacterized oxidoreductase At4g09670-like [Cajanus cajan]
MDPGPRTGPYADIARKVSRAVTLAPNAALHAVGSRSLDKVRAFAVANGFPAAAKVYGSYEAVLQDPVDVDAVYVPLPTSLHVRWVVLAARSKKHVLLEKPVALSASEFDEIVEAPLSFSSKSENIFQGKVVKKK